MTKINRIIFLLSILLVILLSSCVKQDKCVKVSCNDNNPCTVDSCNSDTGLCSNTPKSCSQGNVCNKNTGQCESANGGLDKIESAINKKIPTTPTQSNKMDTIEQAIKNRLS